MENKNLNLESMRHSTAHLLAAAVLKLYPDTKFAIGPAIEDGFYYDFDFSKPVSEEDLKTIEKTMVEIKNKKYDIEYSILDIKNAKERFKDQPYKLELISDLEKEGEKEIGTYALGDFVDLCRGPHLDNTEKIGVFKLMSIAGAYWKGDEKNRMLTRIYGVAFKTKEELNDYLQKLEEAKKRDHRKLGKELNLFHIDEQVGLGLPLWHPKGAILWRVIEDFWYREHLKGGYELVRTPHIGNRKLWEMSGHWGFYNASMYPPMEVGQSLEERQEGKKVEVSEEYLLKPMNCPFHIQIYKDNPKSYREFPMRWAECGTVYRFEKKGELSGLTRVRGFTQDDAHIICRSDQVEVELKRVVDFILHMFGSFGFSQDKIQVYLSLRDKNNMSKYAGNDEGWELTENILRKVAQEKELNFKEEEGEAAFYGPKLDFKIRDVLGREWQCSTLQFDFNLPERFDMTFKNAKGEDERPYVLHRALFGSFERFIGLLIEHYAGAFPLWLAPVQIKVLPVSDKFLDYAKEVADELRRSEFRLEVDDSDESLGKKIRNAEMQKIPYMIIIGEKEIEGKNVTVRSKKDGDLGSMSIEDLINKLADDVGDKK
uniref:Threonine--tRNA ligase n=1 Tax=candidate division CPR3 bacterium TaxID=2268181 RepID=A0A7C4R7Y8_UNCC3